MTGLKKSVLTKIKVKCPNCRVKIDSASIADAIFEAIIQKIWRGESVKVANFGTFHSKMSKARMLTTIHKKKIHVSSRRQIFFRAAKQVKLLLNSPIDLDLEDEIEEAHADLKESREAKSNPQPAAAASIPAPTVIDPLSGKQRIKRRVRVAGE